MRKYAPEKIAIQCLVIQFCLYVLFFSSNIFCFCCFCRVAEDGSTIRTLKRKAEEDAEKMEKLENDQLLSLWVLQADPDSSR